MIGNLTGGDAMPEAVRRQVASRVLDSELVDSLLTLLAERERALLVEVQALREHAEGLDATPAEDLPTPEDRQEQIRAAGKALVTGEFHQFYADHVAGFAAAGKAVTHAGTDWEEFAETIHDRYPADAVEGDDPEAIAAAHVRQVHEVDPATFRAIVCEWDDDTKQDALRDLLVGGLDRAEAEIEEIRAEVTAP